MKIHAFTSEDAKELFREAERLRKIRTVKVIPDTRGAKDQRYKVDLHIVEYRDEDNREYRKSFTVRRGEKPNIPESGTHAQLNALSEQHLDAVGIMKSIEVEKNAFFARLGVDPRHRDKWLGEKVTLNGRPAVIKEAAQGTVAVIMASVESAETSWALLDKHMSAGRRDFKSSRGPQPHIIDSTPWPGQDKGPKGPEMTRGRR
jgi:ribosomal protein S18 acetylase RimI-like enzyme